MRYLDPVLQTQQAAKTILHAHHSACILCICWWERITHLAEDYQMSCRLMYSALASGYWDQSHTYKWYNNNLRTLGFVSTNQTHFESDAPHWSRWHDLIHRASKLFQHDRLHCLTVPYEQCHQTVPKPITTIEFECQNCVQLFTSRFGLQSHVPYIEDCTTDISSLKLRDYKHVCMYISFVCVYICACWFACIHMCFCMDGLLYFSWFTKIKNDFFIQKTILNNK